MESRRQTQNVLLTLEWFEEMMHEGIENNVTAKSVVWKKAAGM